MTFSPGAAFVLRKKGRLSCSVVPAGGGAPFHYHLGYFGFLKTFAL